VGVGTGVGFGVGGGLGDGVAVGFGAGFGFGVGVGVARDGAGDVGSRNVGAGASCAEIRPLHARAIVQIRKNLAPFFISGAKNSRARGIVVPRLRRSTRFSARIRAMQMTLDEVIRAL
jgi:hypothetical protein